MRSKTTIEFLGLWEQLNNPTFKGVEFDLFLYAAGSNAFTLSPSKWIEQGIPSSDRLMQLNKIAIQQLKTLSNSSSLKKLY